MLYGVEAQNPASVPVAGYIAKGVYFDGVNSFTSTNMDIASLIAVDNGSFSFSFWVNDLQLSINNNHFIWGVDPFGDDVTYAQISISGGAYLYFQFSDNGTNYFGVTVGPYGSGWHHFLGSAETNHAAGAKIMSVYVDDVLQVPFSVSDLDASINPALNGKEFVFPDHRGAAGSDGFVGDLADAWIAPGINLIDETGGTISDATRRLFTTADLRPIDPTTFPSSAILYSGNAAAFSVNQGTGGAAALTGVLTDAATNP